MEIPDHVIVVKSTVVPGTTEKVVIPILEKYTGKKAGEFGICMNPEFLTEISGTWSTDEDTKKDFFTEDRIVIGEYDKKSGDVLEEIYEPLNKPIFRTDLRTAEMIKYASNCMLAAKISYCLHEYRAYDHVDFNEYNFLKEKVGRYDVVMSDKTTSWLIPTYSGKAVCLIHTNPLIPDLDERLEDVGTFFDANTTSETRVQIIKKYNVSYILLNLDLELFDDETIVAITELGNITFQNSHFILIEPTNFETTIERYKEILSNLGGEENA